MEHLLCTQRCCRHLTQRDEVDPRRRPAPHLLECSRDSQPSPVAASSSPSMAELMQTGRGRRGGWVRLAAGLCRPPVPPPPARRPRQEAAAHARSCC